MVITRQSYEAALLGTAEDLKSRGASLTLHASQGFQITNALPSGSASYFDHIPAPLYAILPLLSSHDRVDELVHKDS